MPRYKKSRRVKNYKVVSEVICHDGSVIKNVGGNVFYFGKERSAINFASKRSVKAKASTTQKERTMAMAVYGTNPTNGKHDIMKYRVW